MSIAHMILEALETWGEQCCMRRGCHVFLHFADADTRWAASPLTNANVLRYDSFLEQCYTDDNSAHDL